jgi:outer membrane protein assembly factor BamB/predicted phosphodiesterase
MRYLFRSSLVLCILFLSTAVFAQRQSFRFAWLSDTHVGAQTGAADLSNSVRDINGLDNIAFVILSGDITEMGSDFQLETAKSILDSLKKPYYIIPGNHDTKWSQSGCTKFLALWGSDKFTFTYGGYGFIGIHQGPIMKMGDGHFSPEDLRWLDSAIATFSKTIQPLFFVTHYPLDPGIDNWYTVTERLKQCNTQVVLAGHGHANAKLNFEGLPAVMGQSNLRARKPVGAYTIVDVKPDTVFFSERTPGSGWKSPWHTVGLGQRDFSRDTVRYSRPDFAINNIYPGTKTQWRVDTRFTIASTPAVWKDCVIAGNSSGTVNCYSVTDGSLKWNFTTAGTVYSTPDVSDGRVVIGSSDRNIYCLDADHGTCLWKIKTGAPVVAAAAIHDNTVYIGGSDGVFRALDLKTGAVKWEFKNVGGFVETKPLIYDEKVIFGAWDTYLYALSAKDGSLLWKWSNGNAGVLLSPAACWPVAANGKVFIVAPDRFMTAIDAQTGKTIWRSKQHQVRECVGISGDGKRIYVRCMTDTVVAFSSSSSSPEEVWATNCGYGYDIDPSMPIERDGVVYFGTKNGLVFALDSKSGAILWQHKIGVTIANTPLPLENRRVIISDLDGKISLIEEQH